MSVAAPPSPTSTGTRPTRLLFRRLRRTGDGRARDVLVRRYLPLARRLARRYYSGGEPMDDLVQVANLGLVKAVDRFDETRGVPFTSYAVPTITGELRRYFRDNVWPLHVPRSMQERALAVKRASHELADQTGRTATVAQISERLELDGQDVLDGLKAYEAFDTLSLDAPVSAFDEAEPQTRSDTLGCADPGYELVDARLTIAAVSQSLSPRERRILYMRVVEDRTQTDIANRLGVSQMQVSRLLRSTIEVLQRSVERSTEGPARG